MSKEQNTSEPILERPGNTAPSSPPPDANDTKRREITGALIGGKLSTEQRAAHLDQLRRLTSEPDAVAREDAEAAKATEKVPAAEKRRRELSRLDNPNGIHSKDAAKREAALRELRGILAAQDAEANPRARSEMSLEMKRAEFGVVPEFVSEAGAEAWDSAGEEEALDYAQAQGLDAAVVRDFVTDYIEAREGNEDTPMSDADLDALEQKYIKRGVAKEVTAEIRRWARERGYA